MGIIGRGEHWVSAVQKACAYQAVREKEQEERIQGFRKGSSGCNGMPTAQTHQAGKGKEEEAGGEGFRIGFMGFSGVPPIS